MATLSTKRAGHQFVGVGVGAIIFNAKGKVFLAKRGQEASNDQGLWAWPGGEVEFGETLTTAIQRELLEEFDMVIEPICQIAAFDHLLNGGQEHWVSVAFIAVHISGKPRIKEPGKCSDFGWFSLDALPATLTALSEEHLQTYRRKFGAGTVSNLSYVGSVGRSFACGPHRALGASRCIRAE
jgi:8-oxo-dGTP diphosphatase